MEGKWLDWMDTEMKPQDAEGKLPTSMMFGPRILREKFYQLCSPEVRAPCMNLVCLSFSFVPAKLRGELSLICSYSASERERCPLATQSSRGSSASSPEKDA